MPAPAPELSERFQVGTWEDLLEKTQAKVVDPLTEWKSQFEAWRKQVQILRNFETEVFLQESPFPNADRVHRGFLCHLISQGEMLGVALITKEKENPKLEAAIREQLGFMDEFILNLRATFETWHLLEPRRKDEKNPLDAFA